MVGADELLASIGDWLGVLHYLARAAERHAGLADVLDEFPYLADTDPALPSVIQKFWDSGAAHAGNLKLLLCGSIISQMQELLAERNPLYGRKTLALDLAPLPLQDAAQFVPPRTGWRLSASSAECLSICNSWIPERPCTATSCGCS